MEALISLVILGSSCTCCLITTVFVTMLSYQVYKIRTGDGATEAAEAAELEPPSNVVQAVGFFKEMTQGRAHHPSIHDCIARGSDAPGLVAYLEAGALLQMVMGPVQDPVHPEKGFIGTMHILTDGTYFWPQSLAYFVQNYAVELPAAFLAHVEGNDGAVPDDISVADLQMEWGEPS